MVIYMIYNIKINITELGFEGSHDKINVFGVFLKIFADYIAIVSSLANFQVDFPGNFQSFFVFFSNITNLIAILYPLDCIFGSFAVNFSTFYKKIIIIIVISLLIPIFSIIFWSIYSKIKHMDSFTKQKKIWISIIVICYNFQPTLISTLFSFQNCVDIDEKLRVKKNINEVCWEGSHLFYYYLLVLPALMLWMIILPGYLLYQVRNNVLSKRRRSFNQNSSVVEFSSQNSLKKRPSKRSLIVETTNMFIFFTEGFKERYYFWEFVLLIRKYLVLVLAIFPLTDSMNTNMVFMWFVFLLFLALQILILPYECYILNVLALLYNITLYATSLTLIFLRYSSTTKMKICAIIPAALSNIAFFLFFVTYIFIYKKGIIKTKLLQLNNYIKSMKKPQKINIVLSSILNKTSDKSSF